MTPTVSFVVPVLNDVHRLQRCLRAIAGNVYPAGRIEIIVVDNGSRDGSGRAAQAAGARVLTVPGLRVGELRNRGAQLARGEVLAFVDADHEIGAAWARSAVDSLQSPDVAAVGYAYSAPPDGTWVQRTYDTFRDPAPGRRDVAWLGSGNMAVRRETFVQSGGFDTTLSACEDVEFCQRLRARGHRVVSDDRLGSIHFGDPATLRELFVSELWRGRGNLKVTLRGPVSLRDLPSAAIPVIGLLCVLAALGGALTMPFGGWRVVAAALATVGAFALLRAALMMRRRRSKTPLAVLQALAVAIVYDVARALALVADARHRRSGAVMEPSR